MGKKIVERKKKKGRGRPSLLDIQKRSLLIKEEEQKQKQNPIPNFKTTPTTPIIPTRGRNHPTSPEEDHTHTDGEEDEFNGNRPENNKKLNSSLNSTTPTPTPLNSGSDSDNHKKRRINAIGDGSGQGGDNEKAEKHVAASNPMDTLPGGQLELDMGPSTPLPEKKLLLFILDRLQKKDTYSVFSEPVDLDELPDYHEIVDHPMDFGTVRKNLADGAYVNLEQFQKDIFLICSNAMQYNSPDTIYFRQARSIQELAKKNFENLRKDSDDNEPERKIVRRGRPPTKNLKKQTVSPLGRAGSEFSSDATFATGTENATWSKYDLRKAPVLVKSDPADIPGRSFHGSRDSEAYSGWLAEHKYQRNGEFTGSLLKGNWMKQGKKQVLQDRSRRNTYNQPHQPAGGREPPVLTTFCGERKQLLAVGLQQEYGYSRSLAFFAANLGSIAWNFVSKKIERSLPPGVKFGHGWVGENEEAQQRSLLFPSPPVQLSPSEPFPMPGNSSAAPSSVEIKCEKSSEVSERENFPEQCMPSTPLLPSSIPLIANRSPEFMAGRAEAVRGMNSHSGSSVLSSSVGVVRPLPPLQTRQNPVLHPRINGFNGAYGVSLPAQVGKLIRSVRQLGATFSLLGLLTQTATSSLQ